MNSAPQTFTSGVGIVLCRMAAVLTAISGLSSIAMAVQTLQTYVHAGGSIASTLVLLFFGVLPFVLAFLLWRFAAQLSTFPVSYRESDPSSLTVEDIVLAGTALIGLYALLFGLLSVVRVELNLIQNADSLMNKTPGLISLQMRIPAWGQLLIGVLLIAGRASIARLLVKARMAGRQG